ncbi:tyrosine-type recombinase/integrase [Duganella vulcania]|uniref:Tyrosine-type recombinase/integrase n=1 Tax=Duganella vulcania TaxID=2692166 RepID=A0A845GEG6_9BURK|nr:tyrosine-type recombinase/integrase [Duganella vulcania]MYM92281.1 tyrosine-type recombinase/integrase [Duganella vulcania]
MERWLDHGVTPAALLPERIEDALTYLTHALGHDCYERWTIARLKQIFPSLADAKKSKPKIFQLLLDHDEVIQWWAHGRLHTALAADAPQPQTVLAGLLHTHRRRFKIGALTPTVDNQVDEASRWLSLIESRRTDVLLTWLARPGRFVNKDAASNTIDATNDAQALILFLRERASRSPHTLRAYAADLRRLINWARDRGTGPLSDLPRNDLLAYREMLALPRVTTGASGEQKIQRTSDSTQARALAVMASVYQYWFDTGYLVANPASGLVATNASRNTFSPSRFLPPTILAACDQWMVDTNQAQDIAVLRRRAIWTAYRYSGVRLAELAWDALRNLPRVEVDGSGGWTLYVHGKGDKIRAVPLPLSAVAPIRSYRLARGLNPDPSSYEVLPLIHGFKGGALQAGGLYDEIKLIFKSIAERLKATDPGRTALLEAASPHWLRHAYAKALVVDHRVPLPVAQSLLGHASIQTTAAYAKTDLTQLREFVDLSFKQDVPP